jgi:hypothetical protein
VVVGSRYRVDTKSSMGASSLMGLIEYRLDLERWITRAIRSGRLVDIRIKHVCIALEELINCIIGHV